jgi:histidinol-phosphate aminotransferase
MAIEFAERIRRIPRYPVAGGYAEEERLVRLASNESPYPPLPAVREAVQRALDTLNRYPDPANALLRARLSDRYGVPASRIAIGNGSCDILLAAGEALLEPGAELVYAWPSFSVYLHLAAASGARAITVALDEHARHDLPAMPQQPHQHRGSARGHRRVPRRGPPPRVRDRRRGLLRVQPARGP